MSNETILGSTSTPVEAPIENSSPEVVETPEVIIQEKEGDGSQEWLNTLPEDLRSDPSLTRFNTVADLAKSYQSAQSMIGGRIPIPTEGASKEVKEEFFKKVTGIPGVVKLPEQGSEKYSEELSKVYDSLGRPKSHADYTFEIPEQFNNTQDKEFLEEIRQIAHREGLNQKQLDALAKPYLERSLQTVDLVVKGRENTENFLKKEWGNTYDGNMESISGLMSKYAGKFPGPVKELFESPAGNNPVVLMMASELANLYKEKGSLPINPTLQGRNSPEEAKQKIGDILSNKVHAYHNAKDPAHQQAVEAVSKLYADAYPDKKI